MPLLRPALPQRIKTSPTPPSHEPQHESDGDESMPPSPASATSDASTGSWSKMSQISRGPPAIRRHPEYYIDSGDVVFQVETYLFKVHRYFFVRESQKFKSMLHAPARSGNNNSTAVQTGSSDACAIELRDVTAKEFCRFLWVFYNPEYSYSASVPKWSSILRLAHLWSFPQIKDLAIREMDKLDICPVDKAVMAREFAVDPQRGWLETAYAALGAREQPLTKEEGTRLGLDVVLLLAEVRERIRTRRRKEQNEARKNASVSERAWFLQPPPPPIQQEIPQHAPPHLHTYETNPDSIPPSPIGSEDSYDDPQMVQSTYLPARPHAPPSQIPPYFDPNANMSQSGSSSSMNRHSLTMPASSSSTSASSQHHHHQQQQQQYRRDCASPATKSYTDEDVSDVKSVFAP